MSSTVSYWIFNSARNRIAILQGGRRFYSRGAANRNQPKWRLSSLASPTVKTGTLRGGFALQKAYRHTSTEEEDFHLQLSPEQVNDMLRAGESSHKILDFNKGVPSSVLTV
ncbi:[Pyruvate dehydrogenase [acetyl-transferring]]-phosphatase 2, mitochondrial [Microtus ochrogaster]|uniref:[Pyruvate dehydrogenase [acetyl-transferring]]-phosphatase 2, mitochondrial n=1 Tax=Microtus ochrogaster TaxID=79684 RepID=A0A8J6FXJ6_MICOH|nr:[Pyruvate dehydrogenase [acetyl-transferring]]-phosphatase 2, mitochondrial [Microtus ochrogaster]KAH0503703.1 [Pyruvate dehydrogenase [acetyl-transferring]]-phosphatase 2, mitochondrial [Microtus ochrogaster]